MPSLSKTFLVAVATTGALASIDHQLVQRELVDALDNQLITRDEAEHLIDIWARDADPEPLLLTRDIAEGDIEGALIARSEYDHLDDVYARDLDTRNLQIRSDIEAAFHDHEGLFSRALQQQEAILRVRELAYRDPELFQLYRRGVKMTSFLGAVGGAMVAGKGNRMKGAAIGGALGFGAHKLSGGIKGMFGKKSGGGEHHKSDGGEHHHKRGSFSEGGDGGGGGGEYRRRDIDDPELFDW